jgi:hypothetical protein
VSKLKETGKSWWYLAFCSSHPSELQGSHSNHQPRITGSGLLALQGSRVLEIVDMKDSFSRRIDLVSVLPILRTMFPFKLFHVWRFHALIAANPWSKRECSLLQISADVRYNAAPVVITFVIVVAACLAWWTVTGVVFYLARLVNSRTMGSCRMSGC